MSASGLRFHGGSVAEKGQEGYCSCAKPKSPRNIEWSGNEVRLVLPEGEHAAIILMRSGAAKPVRQRNLGGVSVYGTNEFMVWVRFADSKQRALQFLREYQGEGEKHVVSTKEIERVGNSEPSKIFVYESSFGDVFGSDGSYEGYTGEQTSGDQQLYSNLKRSSYSTLEGSYPVCWL